MREWGSKLPKASSPTKASWVQEEGPFMGSFKSFMMLTLCQQLKVQNGGQEVVAGPQRKLVFHLDDFEHEQEMTGDRDSHLGKSKPKAACPIAQTLVGCGRIK